MAGRGRPFVKGQSGNPNGRPKSRVLTQALLKQLVKREAAKGPTYAERIVLTGLRLAAAGDAAWAKLIFSYAEGMPVQALEHSGGVTLIRDYGPVPVEEV